MVKVLIAFNLFIFPPNKNNCRKNVHQILTSDICSDSDSICTYVGDFVGGDSETQYQVGKNLISIIQRINPFSAGTVFIRQNLTSTDVRF